MADRSDSKDTATAEQHELHADIEKTSDPDAPVTNLTPAQQKATIRAIDFRVTGVLGLLYLIG